jgi:site-specific DNA recombinase
VSTEKQVDGVSLHVQEEACRRCAEHNGFTVVGVERDEGVSGVLLDGRPALCRALEAIQAGSADALIVTRMDRAGRDMGVLIQIRQRLDACGGTLHFADGFDPGRGAIGNLVYNQLGAVAQFEREILLERNKAAQRRIAEMGRAPKGLGKSYGHRLVTRADVMMGRYPYTMLGQFVIVGEEAAIVRRIYEMYIHGVSETAIADALNRAEVPAPGGKTWYNNRVGKILTNPRFKGEHRWYVEEGGKCSIASGNRDRIITQPCPAVVSAEDFDRVQLLRALRLPPSFANCYKSTPANFLAGFTTCAVCREVLLTGTYVANKSKGREAGAYYGCRKCVPAYFHPAHPNPHRLIYRSDHLHNACFEAIRPLLSFEDQDIVREVIFVGTWGLTPFDRRKAIKKSGIFWAVAEGSEGLPVASLEPPTVPGAGELLADLVRRAVADVLAGRKPFLELSLGGRF